MNSVSRQDIEARERKSDEALSEYCEEKATTSFERCFLAVLGRREPKSSHTTAREPRDWRVRAGRRATMSEPFEFPEFFDYPPYFTCVPRRCRPSALGPSDFV